MKITVITTILLSLVLGSCGAPPDDGNGRRRTGEGEGEEGEGEGNEGEGEGNEGEGEGNEGEGEGNEGEGEGNEGEGEPQGECLVDEDCGRNQVCEFNRQGLGECIDDDTGATCGENNECDNGTCLKAVDQETGELSDFGYCTKPCESFTACPTFWECTEVGNAAGTFCVQDD